ncbi:MAG TPA: 6-bladed beta-propeller [Rhodocyclaceae bacterium]|nr:6-bladed beta-propeller [Rhodocyclaceae bacterium]
MRLLRGFGWMVLSLMVSACAGVREKPQFTMGLDASRNTWRLMWPSASDHEIPRYFYVGQLTGENNFIQPKSSEKSLKRAALWFFDLVSGEAPPIVLDRPQAGVVDESGRILVTDIGRGQVFVFDEITPELLTWDKAEGLTSFISPVGIALGPEGQVFVADADLGLVARLDRAGNPLESIGKGQLARPNGVAYDALRKTIYVADTTAHKIKIFDLEGKLLDEIGELGDGPGQFNFPTHIAIRHNRLYVTDTMNARVQVLALDSGTYQGTVGKRGMAIGDFTRPKGVAADGGRNIYVVEAYFDHLLIFNRRGEFLMPIGGVGDAPGQFHLPAGVWVDVRNRVFVADMMNSRVQVFQFLGGDADNDAD